MHVRFHHISIRTVSAGGNQIVFGMRDTAVHHPRLINLVIQLQPLYD
ncbi:hypothetical protein SDC9_125150 [bioreactor metagenome]|uniref:Uncharacterized protein n=1 Tax=bioreactor metagenome TaxID=1076179 RepID=A0A645CML4_9ZZZZ